MTARKVYQVFIGGAQGRGRYVDDAITNGVTTRAPSQNAVFDALALKATKDLRSYRLEDYGGGPDVADNTTAYNAILDAIGSGGFGTIIGEVGNYQFLTEPNNCYNRSLIIRGRGKSFTVYQKKFNSVGTNGRTNNAGYAIGATSITIEAFGAGRCDANDQISFASDPDNVYTIQSGPSDVINGGTIILTEGLRVAIPASATAFTIDGNSRGLFTFQGNCLNSSVEECTVQAANLIDGSGSDGGHLIGLLATHNASPDFFRGLGLNLNYTGSGAMGYNIYINGACRRTSGSPVGVRDIEFNGCYVFSNGDGPIFAKSYVGFLFTGGWYLTQYEDEESLFTGTTEVPGGYLGTNLITTGNIKLDKAVYTQIQSAVVDGNVKNTSNCQFAFIDALVYSGAIRENNWIDSAYEDSYAPSSVIINGKAVNVVSPLKTFTLADNKKVTITFGNYAVMALIELGTGDATSLQLGRSMDATITSGWPNLNGTNLHLGSVSSGKFSIVKDDFSNDLVLTNDTGSTQTVRLTIFGIVSNIVEADA